MSNNIGMMPAGANQIAGSKASAGMFINMSLTIYVLSFIYRWIMEIPSVEKSAKKNMKHIKPIYNTTMFIAAVFLLIGLSRAIGTQYDLTRFFILAIAIGLNVFFDDVHSKVLGKDKKKNKKD